MTHSRKPREHTRTVDFAFLFHFLSQKKDLDKMGTGALSSAGIYLLVSRKSRLAAKKNRIMKLYFVNDEIGQLYGYVTLTM